MASRFIGLSTGRAGSRYLAKLLNDAGVKTLHESTDLLAVSLNEMGVTALGTIGNDPKYQGVSGEISAHFVTQVEMPLDAQIWHFSRHPQPFVSSLIKFRFWNMNAPNIHPYLRRTGDLIADSFLYWVDWNARIISLAPPPQRTTFRIEDVCRDYIVFLADTINAEVDVTKIDPRWDEKQELAVIPVSVEAEVNEMMGVLGYA